MGLRTTFSSLFVLVLASISLTFADMASYTVQDTLTLDRVKQLEFQKDLKNLWVTGSIQDPKVVMPALMEKIGELKDLESLYVVNVEFFRAAAESEGQVIPQALGISPQLMGEEGAIALAKILPNLKKLKFLGVSHHHIKDKGMIALAQKLDQLTNLKRLDLSANQIGDAGLEGLSKHLGKMQNL